MQTFEWIGGAARSALGFLQAYNESKSTHHSAASGTSSDEPGRRSTMPFFGGLISFSIWAAH
jgi:hypothetical protein